MDPGEQITGTRDEHYNLISVLYHALHGAETIEAYILDAEAAGDERLASFFREAQAMHRQLAERAKGMLGILEVPPEPAIAPDVPPESVAAPPMSRAASPADVPPDTLEGTPPERITGETSPRGEGETSGDQSLRMREQQAAARQVEEDQGEEEKGFIDKVKDGLTGQDGSDKG